MLLKGVIQYIFLAVILMLSSCKVYQQDILFQLPEDNTGISEAVYAAERNYLIQVNDYLEVSLFPNQGEQLIDPNFQSLGQQGNNQMNQMNQMRQQFTYLVQIDGIVKLPMVGDQLVAGLTIDEAEEKLEAAYDQFFKGSFLKLKYVNKRVILLGALNTVIPLTNENISLLEVIALAGGIDYGQKAQNIRVLRGSMNDPQVFEINLTTIEGMRQSMLTINPGDVIYIEPWRRPWLQTIRDVSPILGITSSVATLIFLLINTF